MAQAPLTRTAPILLTRAALPSLRERPRLISNISAGTGRDAVIRDRRGDRGRYRTLRPGPRRELYGEGVPVLTVYADATSPPMTQPSKAGAAQGFDYEPPQSPVDATVDATVDAILDGSLTILRGGHPRRDLNSTNRQDASTVDRTLAERQRLGAHVVAAHTGI